MTRSRDFKATLGAWAKRVDADLDALARQSAQDLAERVVRSTPVDTGFLRGSWQPSLGGIRAGEGKSDPAGAMASAAIGLTIAQMQAGDRFFLTNNAAYALHVEYGTSRMPGRFYVGDNIKAWPAIVQRAAARLRMTA